jgi:hypothetical protein
MRTRKKMDRYFSGYHLLFIFNQFGDIERALLRNVNVYNGSIKSVEIVLCNIMIGTQ